MNSFATLQYKSLSQETKKTGLQSVCRVEIYCFPCITCMQPTIRTVLSIPIILGDQLVWQRVTQISHCDGQV